MTLHGCLGNVNGLGGFYDIQTSGWTQYAAANDLIIIFPQARWSLINPYACFDFIGYTSWFSTDYMTKNGAQMKALKAMIDRVTEPRDPSYDYTSNDRNGYSDFTKFIIEAWEFYWNLP